MADGIAFARRYRRISFASFFKLLSMSFDAFRTALPWMVYFVASSNLSGLAEFAFRMSSLTSVKSCTMPLCCQTTSNQAREDVCQNGSDPWSVGREAQEIQDKLDEWMGKVNRVATTIPIGQIRKYLRNNEWQPRVARRGIADEQCGK